jgi:hypothetical protein
MIFTTASLAQIDDYQKVQKGVIEPVTFKDKGGTPGLWTGAMFNSGSTRYDEVENNAIKQVPEATNLWTGAYNNYWHNANNWSLGHIPTADEDVEIPNVGYQPVIIDFHDEACNSLTISTGATLNIKDQTLTVYSNLTVYGTIGMLEQDATLRIFGNTIWHSGSALNVTEYYTYINAFGNWDFRSGAYVNPATGFINFFGDSDSWIRCYSNNSSFYVLRIFKTAGAVAKYSWLSTQDMVVNNLTVVGSGTALESHSNYNVVMKGNFNYFGTFDFTKNSNTGSAVFSGNTQNINNYSSGSGTFNNVQINSTTKTTIVSEEVIIAKNLTINSGQLDAGENTIKIGGNWTNNAFPTGFEAGTGRVIFNGSGHQFVHSSENFNILEANMGAALRITNPAATVTCSQYEWTAGGIDVIDGTFTALDLAQDGIFGGYWLNPGGVINLTNSDGFVDLNGSLNIFGGEFNVFGGTTTSYWPWAANASINMSGGVLDFKDQGIRIHNSATYSLNESITGGIIRTSGSFSGNRADFTPTAGTFEFYGSGDQSISQSNGCTLYDVVINKSAKEGGEKLTSEPVYDTRIGELLSDGGKSNTISLGSDFTITGNLDIDAGTLSIGQYAFNIIGNTSISGNLAMTHYLSVINVHGDVVWNSGSTANFTAANVFIVWGHWNFENGSNANFADGTILFKGNTSKYIRSHSQTSSFNNVDCEKTDGNWVRVSYLSTKPLTINGNLYVYPGSVFSIYSTNDAIFKGNINSNGIFYSNHGRVVLNGANQILKMNTGNYYNNLAFNQSGTVTINNSLSDILYVKGNVEIQSGVFSLQDREIHIGGNWNNNAGSDAFSEGTSLVVFNGSGELNHQFINGNTTFYDLENAKTGNGYLRFAGNIAVTNDFLASGENMVDGPTLDVNNLLLPTGILGLTSGAPIVTTNNFTMGGTLSVTDGNFSCTDITNDGIYGTIHLYNGEITLNQVGNDYTDLNGDLTIEGGNMTVNGVYGFSEWGWAAPASFTMTGGTLNFNNPGISIISPRNVTTSISDGTMRTTGHFWVTHPNFTPTGGTAELHGNNPVYVQSSGGSHFYNLTIDKPAGSLLSGDLNRDEEQLVAFQQQKSGKDRMVYELPAGRSGNIAYTNGNLKVVNNTVIEEGSLIIEYDASNAGNLTVNEGGKLSLLNLGSLAMGDSKTLIVNSGGEFLLQGNAIDFPKITSISGNYGLNIESGATIGAEYVIFEYMNTAGVNVKPGAHVEPVKSFTNCIFRNGQSGGRLLTLDNNQTLLMGNVSFPGSSGNFNVSKTVDEGVVVLNDYSGAFAGASWEQDEHNRIHWTGEPSPNIVLDGVVVDSYQDFCFEAIETITVGGSQNFVVEAFGEVNLVAGQSILMLPGTHAQPGSYMHAQISDVSFCNGLPLALVAAVVEEPDQHDWFEITEEKINERLFKVFPNPARDIITLELTPPAEDDQVIIEIYNLMGQNLMSKKMEAKPQYQIDLSGLQSGVYLLKVTHGKTPAFTKLIKQ